MVGENEKPNENKNETKPFSAIPLLDEVKAEREKLEKVRDEARQQADRLEKLRAEQLLSGTAGIRPEPQVKQETNKEYRKRIESMIARGQNVGE